MIPTLQHKELKENFKDVETFRKYAREKRGGVGGGEKRGDTNLLVEDEVSVLVGEGVMFQQPRGLFISSQYHQSCNFLQTFVRHSHPVLWVCSECVNCR